MAGKVQSTDIHRKIKLRKTLLEKAGKLTGACYIPFIGEGDIAVALYSGKSIYGADTDSAMVATAMSRLPTAVIRTADCDKFPFNKGDATFCLADFDSYSYPYDSFRSFFKGATIASQCVLFFTDGQRQAIIHSGHYRTPDGKKIIAKTKTEKREAYNFYFTKILLPWFKEYIKPYSIVYITKYLRDGSMCYWGAIIEREGKRISSVNITDKDGYIGDKEHIEKTDKAAETRRPKLDTIKKKQYLEHISNGHTRGYAATLVGVHRHTINIHMKKYPEFAEAISEAELDAIAKVENALYEAAQSGNVTAIQVFLYNRDPKRWSDRRNIQLAGEGGGPLKVEIDAKGKLIQILNRLSGRIRDGEQEKQKGT